MSSALAITATNNSVPLDAQRHGETSFTVYNASGHAMRVRTIITPTPPAQASWFTIAGESERDFPVNGAQQFTVNVAVLSDVATGTYSFRLDAIDVNHPDDDAVLGPAVALEVTTTPVAIPTMKKGYVATLIGGAVGALAGLAIGFLLGAIMGGLIEGASQDAASIVRTVLTWVVALLGAVVGAGLNLRSGNYAHFAETALILGGAGPVWAGLLIGILLLVGAPGILSEGGTPAVLVLCVPGLLILAVPPLAARAITLLWKTGHI